jgi:hypothetical protein
LERFTAKVLCESDHVVHKVFVVAVDIDARRHPALDADTERAATGLYRRGDPLGAVALGFPILPERPLLAGTDKTDVVSRLDNAQRMLL